MESFARIERSNKNDKEMNQTDYINMVGMLKSATFCKKIHWEEQDGEFSTKIGGCLIELVPSYDFQVNVSSYSLRLYNEDGELFETFVIQKMLIMKIINV